MSSPEFLQGGVCSDQGKNPEPKTRTRNLNINVRYVSTWGPEKGIRELLQNFLDGLCTSHKTSGGQSVTPDDYVFAHKVGGGVTFKSWTETWIAKLKEGGKELGSLVWDRKDDKLTAKVSLASMFAGSFNYRLSRMHLCHKSLTPFVLFLRTRTQELKKSISI